LNSAESTGPRYRIILGDPRVTRHSIALVGQIGLSADLKIDENRWEPVLVSIGAWPGGRILEDNGVSDDHVRSPLQGDLNDRVTQD
jgi:hypothetical protein